MRPGSKTKSWRPALAALAVSVVMLVVGMWVIEGLTVARIGQRIVWPLGRLLLTIAAGLAVGQLIESAGWTRKLGALSAPLFRFAHLGPHCGAAFIGAFISGEGANGMLLGYWQEGRIDRFQLILTNLANQLPAFFLHLPTTFFIVLPLTGWAGGLYFIITFLAAVLRLLAVLLVGRWRSVAGASATGGPSDREVGLPGRGAAFLWATLKQKLPARIMGVTTYVVPIYVAVYALNSVGLFEWTQAWLARGFSSAFIPVEALSLVVLSFTAEFASGFATAGALLHEGVLSTHQVVLALLIGNIVAFPIRALRHQLPRLLGIFGPGMGMLLLLLGQGTRVLSLIVVGAVYWVLF